jgi:hypothetical protein
MPYSIKQTGLCPSSGGNNILETALKIEQKD